MDSMNDTGGPPRPKTDPRYDELRSEVTRRMTQSGNAYVVGGRPMPRMESDRFVMRLEQKTPDSGRPS
jgi:hypothetical protein